MISRSLYKYCQNNFRGALKNKIKKSPLSQALFDKYYFGELQGKFFYFNAHDIEKLKQRLIADEQLNFFIDKYPEKGKRVSQAGEFKDEKFNALAVNHDYILLNSLNLLCLNQQTYTLPDINAQGIIVCASDIKSVQHSHIIMVENLEVMGNLALLNLPESLKNALFLYRGDIKPSNNTHYSYLFFRRFKQTNRLIFFGDLDPAGSQMALNSGATQWLGIEDLTALNSSLRGIEQEWIMQRESKRWLDQQTSLPLSCQNAYDAMKSTQKTLQQEHMLAKNLALSLFSL
ncbi:hypothetical protein PCNPT3_06945 [Psychromonas sp. CNPT3]|uniref:DUF7281 domain-containing protein n=1 Tax=Psychromonas sp. CNPT3 TaxID=314282 RepID=UPI00006E56B9|nr:hypothetical protein [Psychromonas sp. CNPT3]AGH81327.1 hypothetical protein PCNPT3_06945 [Psychromonas sp. CNPT3]